MTKNNVRSNLFYLKQFCFNDSLLQKIFLSELDPIEVIFNKKYIMSTDLQRSFTKKDKELSASYETYKLFKTELYKQEDFLRDKIGSKIYFKYDINEVTTLIPRTIMPFFMYAKGNISLLASNKKRVAIIGTRYPSSKSIAIAKKITQKFIEDNYVIVSGLAEGIDTISHETTLFYKGETIAVLPTNFKNIYPKKNETLAKEIEEQGLLLTAIGPTENTYKSSFLDRNQYVANISDVIVVIETNLKSGTMNTIRNASEANKKILFVDQEAEEINNKIYEFGGEMLDD